MRVALIVALALWAPATAAAAPETESFPLVPGQAPYTTKMEFEGGKDYRFDVSGTMRATGPDYAATISAFHCLSGTGCEPSHNEWDRQNFIVKNEIGASLGLVQAPTVLPKSETGEYSFVYSFAGGAERFTFAPLPNDAGPVYGGAGFGFTITELTPTFTAPFGFHVDGFPDRPDDKFLPDDLVGVELETSDTRVFGPQGELEASGVVTMTTSYLARTTDVRERRVRFVIDRQRGARLGEGAKRAVLFAAEVKRSQDRNCPAGTHVTFLLAGGKGEATLALEAPDGTQAACLSRRVVRWTARRKFKKARIGRLKPVD